MQCSVVGSPACPLQCKLGAAVIEQAERGDTHMYASVHCDYIINSARACTAYGSAQQSICYIRTHYVECTQRHNEMSGFHTVSSWYSKTMQHVFNENAN